jgi:tetratricopeptide (TPR) repeat protein
VSDVPTRKPGDDDSPEGPGSSGLPSGDVYDWYVRGHKLLTDGNAAAAVQLLRRAVDADPGSHAARETLARALFDARLYAEALEAFAVVVAENPANDYAQFGLGLAAMRSGDHAQAVKHLALAAAMRPEQLHYATALRAAKVRLEAAGEPAPEDAGDGA